MFSRPLHRQSEHQADTAHKQNSQYLFHSPSLVFYILILPWRNKKIPKTDNMENKRFTKNDNGFICKNCGKEVLPLGYTSRNHCPFCLCSLHVDINPGDRSNDCGGILRPIKTEPDPKKGYVIIHRCDKCGAVVRNKAAHEAKVQPDDMNLIIRLTAGLQ